MHQKRMHTKMEKRTLIVGISVLVLIVAWFSYVEGTTIKKMNLGQLTREATYIVIGTVMNLEEKEVPYFEHRRALFTEVTLNVEQWFKGRSQAKGLVFRYLRGIGGRVFVGGAPTVTRGEKVLVFLAPDPRLENAPLEVVGLIQGRYVIRGDRAVQPEFKKGKPLQDFINEIQGLIATQNKRP